MDEILTPEMWQAVVEALGPEGAEAWRQRNGVKVEGLDAELPPVGGSDDDGDLALQPNFKLGVPGADAGLTGLYSELEQSQERSRAMRMQLLQEATQALQQRRMGPDTAEKLYAISAAMFSPTKTKGFSGMMGNLMPVVSQMRRADREGEQTRQDAMLKLRQQYLAAEGEGEAEAIQNKINLYKASRTGAGMHVAADPYGNRFNTKTGFDVPTPRHIQGLLQNPTMASDFDIKFGPGASARVLSEYGGQ